MKVNIFIVSFLLIFVADTWVNAQGSCSRNLSQTPLTTGSASVTFTAISAYPATQWDWYENGTKLGNAADYTVSSNVLTVRNPSNKIGRQYYCLVTIPTCTLGATNTITLAYDASITSTTPGSVCGGGNVTLGATASSGTVSWYSAATGGTLLGTGISFITPSLGTTTTYYAEASPSGSRTAVVAIVNTVPSITSTTPATRCGSGTVTLSAVTIAGTINWYPSASGGNTPLGTGTNFTSPSITNTTTYYVDAFNNGCTSTSRTAVTATINPAPTITSTTPGSRCGSGTVILGATVSAGNINWYSTLSGGTSLGIGTNFTTPTLSVSTTYYAEAVLNGCNATAGRTAVVATINVVPTITSTAPALRCGTGTVTLGATTNAGTINWYPIATGAPSIGTGTSFTTPSFSVTTTYYVDAVNNGCVSLSKTAVVATNTTPIVTTVPGSRCGPGSVILGATSNVGTLNWFSASTGGSSLGSGTSFTTPPISATTPFYVEPANSSCLTNRVPVMATVGTAPTVTGTSPASRCGIGLITLGASASLGRVDWYSAATGGTYLGTGTTFTPFLSATTTYYAQAANGSCFSTRTAVVGTANNVITSQPNAINQRQGTQATFSVVVSGTGLTYQWRKNGVNISGANSLTYTISNITSSNVGNYDVVITASGCSVTSNTASLAIIAFDAQADNNYVKSRTIQKPGILNENQILYTNMQESTVYFDGLGRPVQQVTALNSPSGLDIIQPMEYDQFGREVKKYLPYTLGTDGFYKPNALVTEQSAFYTTQANVVHDGNPFSQLVFDNSPLNRVVEQGSPGASWQPGTNHTVKKDYQFNIAGEVVLWSYSLAAGLKVNAQKAYYDLNQLYKNVTTDEASNKVVEYTDKQGRTVLKKVQVGTSPNNTKHNGWACTYYIYDDYGQLSYVLQPQLIDNWVTSNSDLFSVGFTPSATDLYEFSFSYQYDNRGRMSIKKVPGAEPVYMVYDNRDRLVLTQDGNQRASKQWLFTKYDALNRPVSTGLYTAATVLSQADMQITVNNYYNNLSTNSGAWFDTFSSGGVHDYDNKSFPVVTDPNSYLTVSYYDNYDFTSIWPLGYGYEADGLSEIANTITYNQPATANAFVKGLVTGTKVKVLDGGGYTWLSSTNYYDDKYRPIQTKTTNYKGGIDKTSSVYDFVGKVLKTKTAHIQNDVTWKDIDGAAVLGNRLIRTASGNNWTASGAASEQQLPAGVDGWMEFTVSEITTNRMTGLASANPDLNYTSIDYAFYLNLASLKIYEKGLVKATITGALTPREILRIERAGTTVKYYRNNLLVYTSLTSSNTLLMVDASLNTYNASTLLTSNLINVHTSFGSVPTNITRRLVYDHAGRLISTFHKLGNGTTTTWTNMVGTNVTNGVLTNTAGGWNAGALSQEFIPVNADGWLEFPAYEIGKGKMIGLSEPNAGTTYSTIDYALYLNSSTLYVYENGVNKGSFGTFNANDVFRIERKQGVVSYYKNGTVFYTSATSSSIALYADCSFNTAGGHISSAFIGTDIGGSEIEIVHNDYNELGQLVDKKLHSANGTIAKQSVDYRYNIRGWLTSMNNAALTSDNGTTNDDTNDYFGMSLSYDQVDTDLGNSQLYNGNIAGMKWSSYPGTGVTKQKGYVYSYDPMNRILGSTYKEKGTTWSSLPTSGFAETGFLYDLNGNIKTLTRNDKRSTGTMDILTYDYGTGTAQSNKLLKVGDTGDKVTGFIDGTNTTNDYTYDLNGNMLTDQNKGITSNITYNHLNLPVLITKGGNSIQYIYDATGRKLSQVTTFGGRAKQTDYVGEFVYENDALQFINHEEGRVAIANTTLVYTNSFESTTVITPNNATLTAVTKNGTEKYVQVTSTGTIARSGATPIGNILAVNPGERYLIRVKGYRTGASAAYIAVKVNGIDVNWPGATLPTATDLTAPSQESWVEQKVTIPTNSNLGMEVGVTWDAVTSGQSIYLNEIEITRLDNTAPEYQYNLKDHLGNVRVTFTTKQETEAATATLEADKADDERSKFVRYDNARFVKNYLFDHTNGSKPTMVEGAAQRLSGQVNEVYGLGRSLSVMPGDVINMEVYGKYIDKTQTNLTPALATLLGQIATGTAGGVVVDGSAYTSSTSSFPFPTNEQSNIAGSASSIKAYLSWLVFDRDHNFILSKSGYTPLPTTAIEKGDDVVHAKLSGTVTITEPGYVYVFVSNEGGANAYEVYFDDFKVTQAKSPVIAMNDYYPFGLTFNSYSRENSVPNRWKFQGQEHNDDLGLGWDSFKWRNHQPDIGRFFNIDPLAEKYVYNSPYAFSENHVTTHVELEGLECVHFSIRQYNTGGDQPNGVKTIDNASHRTQVDFTLDIGKKSLSMGKTDTNANPILFGELKNAAETGSVRGVDFEPEVTVQKDGSLSVHGDLNYFGSTDVDINVKIVKSGLQIKTNVDDIEGTTSVAVFAGDETGSEAHPNGGNTVLVGNTTPHEGSNLLSDKELKQTTTVPLTGNSNQKIIFDNSYKNEKQAGVGSTILEH